MALAHIYKEKYFKDGQLVDAKLDYGPSHIWRSIWLVMDLVKDGYVWRVGNGKRVWRDKWVPSPSSYQIQIPINKLESNDTVDALIDKENKTWKKEVIDAVFSPEEAHSICSIPISARGSEDKII